MHSVVILGDTRIHLVKYDPALGWDKKFGPTVPYCEIPLAGGAYFHIEAIKQLNPHLKVFSFELESMLTSPVPAYQRFNEQVLWDLVPTRLSQFATTVTRLFHRGILSHHAKQAGIPLFNELSKTLSEESGVFEPISPSVLPPFNMVNLLENLANLNRIASNTTPKESAKILANCSEQLKGPLQQYQAFFDISVEIKKAQSALSATGKVDLKATQPYLDKLANFVPRMLLQEPTCPDIVVIDDLNLGFRQLLIETHSANSLEATSGFEIPVSAAAQARLDLNKEESTDEVKMQSALLLLLERFQRLKLAVDSRTNFPVMEPVIIGSISGAPSTIFAGANKSIPGRSFWQLIGSSRWLKARLIIILDVEDLRADGLSISSGLSWERTVQDTIAELHRALGYEDFMTIGNLVIRYGVTGALQITNKMNDDKSYTLFFDPEHDDAQWASNERDNVVLGTSALYTSTIVQSICSHCEATANSPLLGALPMTVTKGLPKAIARCRMLARNSYGQGDWKDFFEITQSERLFPPLILDDKSSSPLTMSQISETSVPAFAGKDWSILSQSVQTQVGKLARLIVQFGPSDILNQPRLLAKRAFIKFVVSNTLQYVNKNLADDAISTDFDLEQLILDGISSIYDNRNLFGSRSKFMQRELFRVTKNNGSYSFVKKVTEKLFPHLKNGEEMQKALNQLYKDESLANELMPAANSTVDMESMFGARTYAAPFIRFDTDKRPPTFIIDKQEIEGVRSIEKLIRSHIEDVIHERNQRPLSIAVFGPPGSGKSTAVKSVCRRLTRDSRIQTKLMEGVNLSQFSRIDELSNSFQQISQECVDHKIPIAFFDEFDCISPEAGMPLGWLKYFLAPMEDGTFRSQIVKNAVFVFAGGTKTTFNDFSLAGTSRDDEQWVQFTNAKGPDFVSRLRGHLNIVGINPVNPDDELYLVRRSLLIRTILSEMQGLAEGQVANIDPGMLRAILHVPMYWHGGRSLRMLLELCSVGPSRKISASSVPPVDQLNMLVDGKAFIDLLKNIASPQNADSKVAVF